MGIESGLVQQTSTFAESLQIKPSPAVEKSTDETGQESKIPEQGDTVNISKEARALSAPEESGNSSENTESGDSQDQLLKAQQEELELEGLTSGGGTSANGAGNSVADF